MSCSVTLFKGIEPLKLLKLHGASSYQWIVQIENSIGKLQPMCHIQPIAFLLLIRFPLY